MHPAYLSQLIPNLLKLGMLKLFSFLFLFGTVSADTKGKNLYFNVKQRQLLEERKNLNSNAYQDEKYFRYVIFYDIRLGGGGAVSAFVVKPVFLVPIGDLKSTYKSNVSKNIIPQSIIIKPRASPKLET